MPSKRKPIEYTPAGGSIFRPQGQVEEELATVEGPDEPVAPPVEQPSFEPRNERTDAGPNGGSADVPGPPFVAIPTVPHLEEPKIRHSFDIPRRQLDALYDIQDQRRRQTGRKPKMGDLVTEALAAFIARHHEG